MNDKKIKHVNVTVDLPVKLIERLEQRFDKNKKLINQFIDSAVKEYLEKKKTFNYGVDKFIAEAIEEAL
ncbi:hypothetical protein HZA40_03895 [Candidatus Peregrinibacteria bacterium]|nr:hypothetical protein [Candidatus Peregrinibacteria bacterium]